MSATNTTLAVQRFLDDLAAAPVDAEDPVVRALLARSVHRLHQLCARMLHGSYPRLTRSPACLDAGDVLGAVVERLLKALRQVKPPSVRQFFGLANRHIRWELNGQARGIDQKPSTFPHSLEPVSPPAPSTAGDATKLDRILAAIEALPEPEREVFELVRIQGLTQVEAAELLDVADKTIQRRLRRAVLLLADALGDLVAEGALTLEQPHHANAADQPAT